MLIDARTLPEGKNIQADVCIVGAGVAGIALARELRAQPFRVCLLESGGLELDDETQSLYSGRVIGLPYLPLATARLRYFGGTSNHWTGWCQPLDEIDFAARPWIPYSGWPFGKSHLVPFYERAQSVLQLGPFAYKAEAWETSERTRLPFLDGRISTKIVQFSSPTRFGQVYRDEIAHAENIRTYLNANAREIETTKDARTVTRIRVACLQGPQLWVSAKLFILATGGIENARLLLLSNKVQSSGLGNQYDLVGRFFMDHAGLESGLILLSHPNIATDLYKYYWQKSERPVLGELILSPEIMGHEKVPNFCAVLKETRGWETIKGDDVLSFLRNVITNIDDITKTTYRKLFNPGARYPIFRLYNIIEPIPDPENRISLTAERDSLGQNRVQLNWRYDASDRDNIRRVQGIIGKELGRAGLGRLRVMLDNDDESSYSSLDYGFHHMGTTRMHVDPKQGVVDQNCQVHGTSNLFIAGSSVFPTYGYAQPTLTIVALTLRLADHVKRLLR